MEKLKVLITGASGFVGGHLIVGLKQKGYKICAIANKNSFPVEVKQSADSLINLDLLNDDVLGVLNSYAPDVIIHAAALSKPDE